MAGERFFKTCNFSVASFRNVNFNLIRHLTSLKNNNNVLSSGQVIRTEFQDSSIPESSEDLSGI